jgi:hypothetical protein
MLLHNLESFIKKEVKRQTFAVTSADLQIYVSNSTGSPNEEHNDKAVYHNNIKTKSKVT